MQIRWYVVAHDSSGRLVDKRTVNADAEYVGWPPEVEAAVKDIKKTWRGVRINAKPELNLGFIPTAVVDENTEMPCEDREDING